MPGAVRLDLGLGRLPSKLISVCLSAEQAGALAEVLTAAAAETGQEAAGRPEAPSGGKGGTPETAKGPPSLGKPAQAPPSLDPPPRL